MMTSFKSICLLFQTSRLNLYFVSSFSQFVSLQLIMSSKQVDICWTARNRHTSSREIAATHNKQRHICPSVEMNKCWRQQTRSFERTTLVTWIIAVWLRLRHVRIQYGTRWRRVTFFYWHRFVSRCVTSNSECGLYLVSWYVLYFFVEQINDIFMQRLYEAVICAIAL